MCVITKNVILILFSFILGNLILGRGARTGKRGKPIPRPQN